MWIDSTMKRLWRHRVVDGPDDITCRWFISGRKKINNKHAIVLYSGAACRINWYSDLPFSDCHFHERPSRIVLLISTVHWDLCRYLLVTCQKVNCSALVLRRRVRFSLTRRRRNKAGQLVCRGVMCRDGMCRGVICRGGLALYRRQTIADSDLAPVPVSSGDVFAFPRGMHATSNAAVDARSCGQIKYTILLTVL